MGEGLSRKDFLRLAAAGLGALALEKLGFGLDAVAEAAEAGKPVITVAKNQTPAALTRAAVDALGGMKRFVRPGSKVVIKPNAGWQIEPKYAATTNPAIVTEVIRLCKQAGARSIKVMDHPVDGPDELTFTRNGIKQAVEKAGARMIGGRSASLYKDIRLPRGKVLKSSQVLRDVIEADVFINVPIAKVHTAVPLTLGLKNLMGVTFDRGAWHNSPDLNQAIADYAAVVRPHLTIMDAYRILLTNGPKGPGQTRDAKMVIAGIDPVAVDAYTAQACFNMPPSRLSYLILAKAAGVGEMDLRKITVKNA